MGESKLLQGSVFSDSATFIEGGNKKIKNCEPKVKIYRIALESWQFSIDVVAKNLRILTHLMVRIIETSGIRSYIEGSNEKQF